jgi:DNA topoisomerase IA
MVINIEIMYIFTKYILYDGRYFYVSGAAFTRFQTKRLQKIFPSVLADQLISYGSCQFPTLGFVVERYKQVQAFVPEPFWKLKGNIIQVAGFYSSI